MVSARQGLISRVLGGPNQLRVPLYQRHYAWGLREWDDLWNDVARLAFDRNKNRAETHFLGSVVLTQTPTTSAGSGLLVVDGQQRLITFSILLCALRDSGIALPTGLQNKIRRCLALPDNGQSLGPLNRLRLVPTQSDQQSYLCLVNNASPDASHLMTKAYSHFLRRIRDLGHDEDEAVTGMTAINITEAALGGLECVHITARATDNVHRIFESLNNRGTPLTQADLIRNYVFMRLDNKSEDFYEFTWKSLEARFNAEELTKLFWLDLVRDHPTITQRQTYVEQQKVLERRKTTAQLKNAIEDIAGRGHLLELILRPEAEQSLKVRRRLQRLKDWQTTTADPILMYLLECRENGRADSHTIARAMMYLESYFVRRVVMGRATMNMNRVLLAAPRALDRRSATPPDEELRRYLSDAGKHWATDAELRTEVVSKPFYNHGKAHQKMLILKWIEESLSDNEFELAHDLTIEHVMPQTLPPEWQKELRKGVGPGEDIYQVHDQLVHTLGNLTLTRRNQEMSNKPFAEKKQLLRKYGSGLQMTKDITRKHLWNPADIRARGSEMVERIIKSWPGPLSG